jgi:hypothetical protein
MDPDVKDVVYVAVDSSAWMLDEMPRVTRDVLSKMVRFAVLFFEYWLVV